MTLFILFLASLVAAAVSGAAGFGGALLLLPLLTRTVGVNLAVPLLTLGQIAGNVSRVAFGFRAVRWIPVAWFLLGAVPASILGAASFVALPKPLVTRAIGGVILAFVVLKHFGLLQITFDRWRLAAGGAVVGLLSGLVGSAGPLGAAIFLTLDLPPVSYIASEATTALTVHALKTIVYQRFIRLDATAWSYAASLSVGMVLGTWLGKKVIERIPVTRFRQFVSLLLVVLAVQMIIFG